ncbi:hypothetical protein [Pontibacter roseus]|uniref:hypothetical protein n=1 Tax=Pontibacter roseus TaxID=336989 RepID=UPI0003695C01|nr:hypothetical protein [Pontibacter roseus]
MKQDQFYYCLSRILELREKLGGTCTIRRREQVLEAAQAEVQQVDYEALRRFAENKDYTDKNTAETRALLKELGAQEAKIRAFVPLSFYRMRIKATQPGQPPLCLLVEADLIQVERAARQ